jgi:biotin--protein ligase
MNVLIYASSASPGPLHILRSVLSPFYTVQNITSTTLATQPWSNSCALLVFSSPPDAPGSLSLLSQSHAAIQQYIAAGGRMLSLGLGVSILPHRPAQDHFTLWDDHSRTAVVPEAPGEASGLLSPASIRLRTGALLSGLRPASVSFRLMHTALDVIHGHWEGTADAIAGIQIAVGSGLAGFWGVSLDGADHSPGSLALLRYALASLGLTLPAESSPESLSALHPVPKYPLPQFLLHQHGKRQIIETILQRLGLSLAESPTDAGVFKDAADTYHFYQTTLERSARLVGEARMSTKLTTDAPRVVLVLPPDVFPPQELTPRFDASGYFAVLEEVRGTQSSESGGWGLGDVLLYGEAVTSTQTMLERCAPYHDAPECSQCHHTGIHVFSRLFLHQSSRWPHSSSQGGAVGPTPGSRRKAVFSSLSSFEHHSVLSRHLAWCLCNTLLVLPSSTHAGIGECWAPMALVLSSNGPMTSTLSCLGVT